MPEAHTEGSEHKPVGAVQPQHLLTTRGCLVFLGLELWVEFLASSLILICGASRSPFCLLRWDLPLLNI